MRALHGEIAPEVLLGIAGFLLIQNSTVESLTSQYALTLKDARHAQSLLQTGLSETDVKDESPSTETVAEEPHESDFETAFTTMLHEFFPEAEVDEQRLGKIKKESGGDLEWVRDALTVVHNGHLEKNNVYDPAGLVGWWIGTQPRDLAHSRAESIKRKPKSQDSILGATLERARRQAPPKPGASPEKVEELKRRNEAARRGKVG